ncbi:ferric-dicitrate binding protein FerR (iron transport regulator) [Dyadobacter sp. BE34]|uniref:Ferric-dicitrate binding protein FerR (Iron transport regulator) n=1 Tax=Dyadobacter fermentans TaxID=94254 RepID=A0ABU1QVT9_9BACT|nr:MULTISPECIES: FecR domain-containing protein [Dyadobacter]MDR6805273.1 ferric-dicitrate binding protein FerR (iron transport regulator) [Dyadobacter fermentans]MDR7042967.1 ferric-dicitrate binding protein FerR (iron transport regulator) [Dyadobacter sp. BE242]MDR7197279.1 ferric-dicitrate binding protein FerR (iron transport regulator) [Dyadobacter sp. BE34]MDR7215286.1 ferric-dicitrate binding protein FerR (iron transport regulator) [Dyadobacter sp. BE31]MDR7262822.1 ferric-dicitrate bind
MNTPLSKEMLFTYFSGQATVLQKQLIEEWLGEPGNTERYFEWLQEWENSHPQFLPDVEEAFKNVQALLEAPSLTNDNNRAEAAGSPSPPWRNWLRVAAAVLLMAGGGYYYRDAILYRHYRTGYAESQTIQLRDGSRVSLLANSDLKLLRWGFGSLGRDVYLTGEAGFVVTHQVDHQPFTVHTPDQGKVTVLGTEFFVYTRKRGTQVVLSKGKVQISSAEMVRPLDMKPGEKASVAQDGKIAIQPLTVTELKDPAVWQEHHFHFDHTTLADASRELNAVFGLEIVVADPALAARQVTGTFKARQADELLSVLSEMLDMRVLVGGDQVRLIPDSTDTN